MANARSVSPRYRLYRRLSNQANFDELSAFLYPIGLYNTRAKRLIEFSKMWLSDPPRPDVLTRRKGLAKYPPTAISHLPGVTRCARHTYLDGNICVRFMEDILRGRG
jgi:endonuclease III